MSCGACVGVVGDGSIRLEYDRKGALLVPVVDPSSVSAGCGLAFEVCPGKGYPIEKLAQEFLNCDEAYDIELGQWDRMWAARSTNAQILCNASSGGAMTEMGLFLLETNRIQGVVVTGMSYGSPGPRPRTYIARNKTEVLAAQGSKYCPSPTLGILSEARSFSGKLAYIGTPCQIGALRVLQASHAEWREKLPYLIGNFCGGFRDYRQTDTLIRRYGLDPTTVREFRYRGGGQPGSLRAVDTLGRSVERPYPEYARDTSHAKVMRCRVCVDATAELADIACGDAWLPRFLEKDGAWSLIVTRTSEGSDLVRELEQQNRLVLEPVSPEEIRESQASNLTSKKRRQAARRRLYRMLGQTLPDFGGGFIESKGGLWREIVVGICRKLGEKAEEGNPACRLAVQGMAAVKSLARRVRAWVQRNRDNLYARQ